MQFFQQGDVLLKPALIPKAAKPKLGRCVLALGEATGHAHVANGEDVEMYEKDGVLYLSAPNGATVTHEEHHAIDIPAGDYTVGIVKEFDHFAEEARNVRD